jgi:hypothetical protein
MYNVQIIFKSGGYTELRVHSLLEIDSKYAIDDIKEIRFL